MQFFCTQWLCQQSCVVSITSVFTADCGYNNICLGYNVYYGDGDVEQDGAYCQFPELPGDYCTTSGGQPGQARRIHAVK